MAALGSKQTALRSIPANQVTDRDLQRSSQLYSNHYGVWGDNPTPNGPPKEARVRMSAKTLREMLLFDDETCFLILAEDTEADVVVGQAFVCRFHLQDLVRLRAI